MGGMVNRIQDDTNKLKNLSSCIPHVRCSQAAKIHTNI